MTIEANAQEEVIQQVLRIADPDRVILFGSYARGDQRRDSDLDILIVMPSSEPRQKRARPFYRALSNLPVEVDVIVYTPQEIEDWGDVPLAFITTAIREGRVLYEKAA